MATVGIFIWKAATATNDSIPISHPQGVLFNIPCHVSAGGPAKTISNGGAWESRRLSQSVEGSGPEMSSPMPARCPHRNHGPPGRRAQTWEHTVGFRSLHPTNQLCDLEYVLSGSSLRNGVVITMHLPQGGSGKLDKLVHRKPSGPGTTKGSARLGVVA